MNLSSEIISSRSVDPIVCWKPTQQIRAPSIQNANIHFKGRITTPSNSYTWTTPGTHSWFTSSRRALQKAIALVVRAALFTSSSSVCRKRSFVLFLIKHWLSPSVVWPDPPHGGDFAQKDGFIHYSSTKVTLIRSIRFRRKEKRAQPSIVDFKNTQR